MRLINKHQKGRPLLPSQYIYNGTKPIQILPILSENETYTENSNLQNTINRNNPISSKYKYYQHPWGINEYGIEIKISEPGDTTVTKLIPIGLFAPITGYNIEEGNNKKDPERFKRIKKEFDSGFYDTPWGSKRMYKEGPSMPTNIKIRKRNN